MITEDYISFETARLLKEKGFKGLGNLFYEKGRIVDFNNYWWRITPKERYDSIEAPTLQMAMKWLREVHNLIIYVKLVNDGDLYHDAWGFVIYNKFTNEYIKSDKLWFKYEEAAEVAIKYCLENLI